MREPTLRRRMLAVAIGACLAGYVIASLARVPPVALGCVALAGAAWWLLRRATLTIADGTDAMLDERQIGLRDRAYLVAYRIIGGVVGVLVLATIAFDLGVDQISTVAVQTVLEAVLLAMIALPTCVVGWSPRSV